MWDETFYGIVLTSATTFYQALITDLVVISPGTRDSGAFQQFPQSQLYQSLGVPGVVSQSVVCRVCRVCLVCLVTGRTAL